MLRITILNDKRSFFEEITSQLSIEYTPNSKKNTIDFIILSCFRAKSNIYRPLKKDKQTISIFQKVNDQ